MGELFRPELIPDYILKISKAFPKTIEILLLSLLFSLLLGGIFAAMGMSGKKALVKISSGWIAFMRGVPTLILIFLLYLGLPQVLKRIGIDLSGVSTTTFIITTLSLSASANMAEMMRSACLAIDKGQKEAALSVGMSPAVAFIRIILPQALGVAIPTLGNNFIMLFKETSLAFTIGVMDLMGKARAVSAVNYGATKLEVYVATAVIFWVFCFVFEKLFKFIEKAYTVGRKA
ncbi:MAG: amino acid ABC transporter permease [Clostridia bacterium]|nr:amino acid ABC transporter permease [Clostridia bacterium]